MTYAEFLRSQGATEEDVKILATPIAEKAFKVQADQLAAAQAQAKAELDARIQYEADSKTWRDEVNGHYTKAKNDAIVAQVNEAKARALIDAAQKAGLIQVAEDLGYVTAPPATPGAPAAPAPGAPPTTATGPTWEQVRELAEAEGAAIALAQDIAAEHARLFPNRPINFRQLREKAKTSRKPLEQVWQEDFGVLAARQAAEDAKVAAHDAAMRAEGEAAAVARLASQYGNPDTRPMSPSTSPFAGRAATGRDKQPWEAPEGQLERDRISRAAQNVVKQLDSRTN